MWETSTSWSSACLQSWLFTYHQQESERKQHADVGLQKCSKLILYTIPCPLISRPNAAYTQMWWMLMNSHGPRSASDMANKRDMWNIYPTSDTLEQSQILFEERSSRTTHNTPPFVHLNQAECLLKHAQLTSPALGTSSGYPLAGSEHTGQHPWYHCATSPDASLSPGLTATIWLPLDPRRQGQSPQLQWQRPNPRWESVGKAVLLPFSPASTV